MPEPTTPPTPTPTSNPKLVDFGPVRKFTDANLQRTIDNVVAAHEAKKGAKNGMSILYAEYENGVAVAGIAVVGKKEIGPGALTWTVVGQYKFDGSGPAAAAEVRYDW